jgi:GlpG protein
MIKATSLDIGNNLSGFSQFLSSQGLKHRINEESGQQVIWVQSEADAEIVRQALQKWSPGMEAQAEQRFASNLGMPFAPARLISKLVKAFFSSPVTLILVVVCGIVAVASSLGANTNPVNFLFYPRLASDNLFVLLGEITTPLVFIQTLTPMFLHFGELHLIFNMLWLLYFGKQLEAIQPLWIFLALIVVTAFVSNTTQYLATGFTNFGGMSGVVYGLVGYTWVIHNFMPRSRLLLNNSMFVFFVIALILMEVFASSSIATAAHVGGLISGLVLGVVMVAYYRLLLRRDIISR